MKPFDLPLLSFSSQNEWAEWLEKNHYDSKGIWLKFYKKGSNIPSVVYKEALEVALCYGWIDGQANLYDDVSYVQRFTPRRSKSIWSKKNIENVNRLIEEGKMQESGLAEITAAKADGRWDQAYDSPKNMQIPQDFLKRLSKDKKAEAFFATLNKTNTYAIAWRLQTAKKPETRERRMKSIIEMLSKEEKLY